MKKIILFIFFAIVSYSSVLCQTTVTFKPNAAKGKDALLATTNGCTPNGEMNPPEFNNYSADICFRAWAWTLYNVGCNERIYRSLLSFEELSTIPPQAEILSAELKLFGLPYVDYLPGNSCYPGSPYYFTNESCIQRVTSTWNENTVTWNTQPTTTTVNQILIPKTTSQWNWNFTNNSDNLRAMIQDMVSNPNTNHGFMFKLQDETIYRAINFVSSDHENPALWPELTVTYKTCSEEPIVIIDTVFLEQPCPCEANFSYMVNTLNLSSYYFMASNSADRYQWTVNGKKLSDAATFSYVFPNEGTYEICYNRMFFSATTEDCEKCINICIGKVDEEPEEPKIEEDDKTIIEVFPNPTKNAWIVRITTEKEEAVNIQLFDMGGKLVYSNNKKLSTGVNSFNINTKNYATGSYALRITGKTIRSIKKLIKG